MLNGDCESCEYVVAAAVFLLCVSAERVGDEVVADLIFTSTAVIKSDL